MLQQLNNQGDLEFSIDRGHPKCKTPRRNADVDAALSFCQNLWKMAQSVHSWFSVLYSRQTKQAKEPKQDLHAINTDGVFVPILPLFESREDNPDEKKAEEEVSTSLVAIGGGDGGDVAGPLLPLGDVNRFLTEQQRSLTEKVSILAKTFPAPVADKPSPPLTSVATTCSIVLQHIKECCQAYSDVVNYVENLLRKQLIAAIGKEVQPQDFSECMEFQNRKMFKKLYQPKAFCYAIRRPDHYPEGTLSIENHATEQPVPTIVRESELANNHAMTFPINAATHCTFFGKRYLHASIMHRFSGQQPPALSLLARARQFSCFILMVGTIPSANTFEPKHAIIIRNKDDLKIPLLLETIPTPKEFKDAIESLSPEQQRFCKAFRGMQLASTLFGICVVQIKPQLEKLLNLPDDSLTKEIKLTQELMEMFITYQIPSDLISYSGPADADLVTKLTAVKSHVKQMQEMIASSKQEELSDRVQERASELMEKGVPDGFLSLSAESLRAEPYKSKRKGGGGGAVMRSRGVANSSSSVSFSSSSFSGPPAPPAAAFPASPGPPGPPAPSAGGAIFQPQQQQQQQQ
mmetsp:Transcript_17638/g.24770  ORF Transcript_17638/g.24770 Transcript_17638/m.24770 type:complete len:576 (+) Transcript_17638:74-1801(+)